jgi:hypothetical protein
MELLEEGARISPVTDEGLTLTIITKRFFKN